MATTTIPSLRISVMAPERLAMLAGPLFLDPFSVCLQKISSRRRFFENLLSIDATDLICADPLLSGAAGIDLTSFGIYVFNNRAGLAIFAARLKESVETLADGAGRTEVVQ